MTVEPHLQALETISVSLSRALAGAVENDHLEYVDQALVVIHEMQATLTLLEFDCQRWLARG